MRVDLTPLVPRVQPTAGRSPDDEPRLGSAREPGAEEPEQRQDQEPGQEEEEMLALDAEEVAAELSSLSVLIDAQPAADLSHILDSLSELAAELSQDVLEAEQSLQLSAAAAPATARRQRPPPPPGRQQPGWPAYVTAGAGAETCPTPSCGGGRAGSRPAGAGAGETSVGTSERSSTEC